jgi:hypothetical protein
MSDIISRIGISRIGSAKDYGPQLIFAAALVPRVIAHLAYLLWLSQQPDEAHGPAR